VIATGLKSATTLVGLTLMLVVAAAWGWSQLTEPFPGKVEPPPCVDVTYLAGEEIYPQDVTVSVLNASDREGLAGFTVQELVDEGFHEGQTGNAPKGTDVTVAEIWVSGDKTPAVALIKSRFRPVTVRTDVGELPVPGVVVVVGDQFEEVADGRDSVTAKSEVVICGPSVD
jgi:LytR cell envelope-related transcriptional attenuator